MCIHIAYRSYMPIYACRLHILRYADTCNMQVYSYIDACMIGMYRHTLLYSFVYRPVSWVMVDCLWTIPLNKTAPRWLGIWSNFKIKWHSGGLDARFLGDDQMCLVSDPFRNTWNILEPIEFASHRVGFPHRWQVQFENEYLQQCFGRSNCESDTGWSVRINWAMRWDMR